MDQFDEILQLSNVPQVAAYLKRMPEYSSRWDALDENTLHRGQIEKLLKGKSIFTSLDYREITKQARPGDIVYMDPPYQGVCTTRDSRYFSGIEFPAFVECVEDLNRRGIDFIISYDGKCGDKQYGEDLPEELGLRKIMLTAGLSSQSLLLGKKETTVEALYLSRNLCNIGMPIHPNQQLYFTL